MELTIDEALKKGVEAHKAGHIQETERLYTAILQAQPNHPDANHNMGVLAVGVGKLKEALPFFKTALESNLSVAQFWLSYIDVLVKLDRIVAAQELLDRAKDSGAKGEAFDQFERQFADQQLTVNVTNTRNVEKLDSCKPNILDTIKLDKALTLAKSKSKKGQLDEAKSIYKDILQNFPKNKQALKAFQLLDGNSEPVLQNPSKMELNSLVMSYQNGQHELCLDLAQSMSKKFPNHPLSWKVLGAIYLQTDQLDAALLANENVVRLDPKDADAHSNLGITQRTLGKFALAEASYKQSIRIKPDTAEVHSNLGNMLQQLGRLEEAKASCIKAIKVKPSFAEAHSNLGIILYINGDFDSALKSIEKANSIDPTLKRNKLLLALLKTKKTSATTELSAGNPEGVDYHRGISTNPLILNRAVEAELVNHLSEMKSIGLDKTNDPRYGNGRWSANYNLFEDTHPIIKSMVEDLICIMMNAVKTDIHVDDSFFNILGAGGGLVRHCHLNPIDKDSELDLAKQKYSLVYYLSIGDQKCSEPGILKLYDPSEDVLPYEGMIVIFPADRNHSVIYGGEKDRVIIGVNFYSL